MFHISVFNRTQYCWKKSICRSISVSAHSLLQREQKENHRCQLNSDIFYTFLSFLTNSVITLCVHFYCVDMGLKLHENEMWMMNFHFGVNYTFNVLNAIYDCNLYKQECISIEPPDTVILKAPRTSFTARHSERFGSQLAQRFQFSQVWGRPQSPLALSFIANRLQLCYQVCFCCNMIAEFMF